MLLSSNRLLSHESVWVKNSSEKWKLALVFHRSQTECVCAFCLVWLILPSTNRPGWEEEHNHRNFNFPFPISTSSFFLSLVCVLFRFLVARLEIGYKGAPVHTSTSSLICNSSLTWEMCLQNQLYLMFFLLDSVRLQLIVSRLSTITTVMSWRWKWKTFGIDFYSLKSATQCNPILSSPLSLHSSCS